jgi:hypothetical protein
MRRERPREIFRDDLATVPNAVKDEKKKRI